MKHLKTHEGFKDWFKKKPKVEPSSDKKDEKEPEVKKEPNDPPTFDLLNGFFKFTNS